MGWKTVRWWIWGRRQVGDAAVTLGQHPPTASLAATRRPSTQDTTSTNCCPRSMALHSLPMVRGRNMGGDRRN